MQKRYGLRYGENPHQKAAFYAETSVGERDYRHHRGEAASRQGAFLQQYPGCGRRLGAALRLRRARRWRLSSTPTPAAWPAMTTSPRPTGGLSAATRSPPTAASSPPTARSPLAMAEAMKPVFLRDRHRPGLRARRRWSILRKKPTCASCASTAGRRWVRVGAGVPPHQGRLPGAGVGLLRRRRHRAEGGHQARPQRGRGGRPALRLAGRPSTSSPTPSSWSRTDAAGDGRRPAQPDDQRPHGRCAGRGPGAGAVLASDAMFPFPDVVEMAAEGGVTAIIQPGGSIRDAGGHRGGRRPRRRDGVHRHPSLQALVGRAQAL